MVEDVLCLLDDLLRFLFENLSRYNQLTVISYVCVPAYALL